MEFKGEILSHLLRIITPRVIAELSTTSQGRKKIPLSSLIETYCENGHYEDEVDEEDETKAKILSFDQNRESESDESDEKPVGVEKEVEEEVVKEIFHCSPRVIALLNDFSRKCKSMDKNILGAKRIPKKKLNESVQSIEDILNQKKRFEKSYGLMKSKEVLDLYQMTAKKNVTKVSDKKSTEDEFSDGERGVLVDKKIA